MVRKVLEVGVCTRSRRGFGLNRADSFFWNGVGSANGLVECYSMAGDVSRSYRCLVGCLSEKVQKELGILVIPRK